MGVTMSNETPARQASVYWALDSRLPRMATHAAVEFDWLIQRKQGRVNPKKSLQAIRAISELISEPIQDLQVRVSRSLVSSVGLELLTEACNESNPANQIESPEDLSKAMQELTAALDAACQERDLDEGTLKKLQDFCIALAKCAMAFRDMVYENSRPHRR